MATEMKVTNKKGAGFYIRAATNFLNGIEAKEAEDGKPAVEAKAPVDELKISGLGEAINVAITVATKLDEDSVASLTNMMTAYPDMDNGRGCAQITITMQRPEAPYLHKFYKWSLKSSTKVMESIAKLAADPFTMMEKLPAFGKEQQELFEKGGKPLLIQSFKHHDKDDNGILDKEEAALFFSHTVSEMSGMMASQVEKQMQSAVSTALDQMFKQLPTINDDGRKKLTDGFKVIMDEVIADARADLASNIAAYRLNKDERHKQAFAVIDSSGDGQLQLDEFIAAFEPPADLTKPWDAKSIQFQKALGFDAQAATEKMQPKLMEKVMPLVVSVM